MQRATRRSSGPPVPGRPASTSPRPWSCWPPPAGPGLSRIVASVVKLAHALGLRVVAEGVEDLRELELLARMRVDRVQGWLFSKAVPHGEV
ncbi:MAG: EAL domain-containing protein, partial [Acidimicrobiales bacterium]